MSRGKFIALEGGEGVGKSTQSALLARALRERGLDVVTTREPGGTPGAEAIRQLLLSPEGDGWDAEAEALLFAAARADHVARLIRPALERGAWVICDRFLDSSRAYQGGASGIGDAAVLELHRIGSGGLLPDLTVLLQADEAETATRLTLRDGDAPDRIGGRGAGYHRLVAETFAAMAAAEPQRFAVVDAGGAPDAVSARIFAALVPLL